MATQIVSTIQRAVRRYPWIAAGLTLTGCYGESIPSALRWGNGIQSTIRPESDSAAIIQHVYGLVTWIDLGIFVVVAGLLIIALVRYREGARKDVELPKQIHGNPMVELIWTAVPAVLLIFIAVPTWQGIFRAAAPPKEGALQVEAVGHQWWWEFKYPAENLVTANELHVPLGRSVVVKTYSQDVIHSIWMPRLAGKIDVLPGKSNVIWFTPEKAGEYVGQCAEFCGTSHANMRFKIIVDSPEAFAAWVGRQGQPPAPATPDGVAGQGLFLAKGCIICHTIRGVPAALGVLGPNLNDLHSRTTIASGLRPNTRENLVAWITHPQVVKPGAKMIVPFPVSEAEAGQLADYLDSAPALAPQQ